MEVVIFAVTFVITYGLAFVFGYLIGRRKK